MDYTDPDVGCPKKAVKLEHSLTHWLTPYKDLCFSVVPVGWLPVIGHQSSTGGSPPGRLPEMTGSGRKLASMEMEVWKVLGYISKIVVKDGVQFIVMALINIS